MRSIIIANGIVQQRSEDAPGNRDASDEPQAEQQPAPVIVVRQGQRVMLLRYGTLAANARRLKLAARTRSPAERFGTPDVVAVVVISIFARAGVVEPSGIALVPVNGAAYALFKWHYWRPSQLALKFRTVQGVAAVVAGAIFHILHQGFRLAQMLQDGAHDFQVRLRNSGRDVVDRSGRRFFQCQGNRAAIIFDE